MMNSNEIPVLIDERKFPYGVTCPVCWNPKKSPHALVVGGSNSGKSYCSKLMLGKLALYRPDLQLYACDAKGDDDFAFLNGCHRFWRFVDCSDGLTAFCNRLYARQSGEDKTRNMLVLFFDEWAAFCTGLDKKVQEAVKRQLASLLMLGRSFQMHIILSQQRADAEYFNTARDNFSFIIGLGNLSEESKRMLFHDHREGMKPNRRQGTGYLLVNGSQLIPVQVPTVRQADKLHQVIKESVIR